MHPRWKLLTAATAGLLFASPSPARADDCAATPTAACYLNAAQALRDTNPGEAAKLFLASYRIEPKIDPLASYGLALAAASEHVAAAEALEKAAEEYEKLAAKFHGENADAQTQFAVVHRLELVQEQLRKLAPNIGRVKLNVPDGKLPAGVFVMRKGGDDVRGSDPTKLIVKPNGDVLVFTFPSGRTTELPVNIGGGLITSVDLPAEPPPPEDPNSKPLVEPVDPGASLQRWAYITGGAGAALTVAGFGYALLADAPKFEITAVLIGGGLAGLGTGGYLWYRAGQKRKASTTALVPTVHSGAIGAVLVGTF